MNFSEWLEAKDEKLYNEINWKNIGRNATMAGALMGAGFSTSNPPKVQNYNVSHDVIKGDQLAQQQFQKQFQNPNGSSRTTNSEVEVKAVTQYVSQHIERGMSEKFSESLIEVIQTKSVEEGTVLYLSFSGNIQAYSQKHANQIAAEQLNQIAKQQNFQISNLQILGESQNQLFKVKIRFSALVRD